MNFYKTLLKYNIESRFARVVSADNKKITFKYKGRLYEMTDTELRDISKPDRAPKLVHERIVPGAFVPEKIKPITDTTTEEVTTKSPGITIFITAYKTQNFIEACLDSVAKQNWFKTNDNWEILVGVDGCKLTLDKLLTIRHKYKNLRIFMMNSNAGTYVTSNTLMELGKYQHYLRFDSDDIMLPIMVESLMNMVGKGDMVRFRFSAFKNNINENLKIGFYSHGIVFFDSKILSKLGGYDNVRCGADTYFYRRCERVYKVITLNKILACVRRHNESLTVNKITGQGSQLRKNAVKLMNDSFKSKNYIKRVVNSYKEY
jgi:glycosyltransferase involved in cell wall biosynthesis